MRQGRSRLALPRHGPMAGQQSCASACLPATPAPPGRACRSWPWQKLVRCIQEYGLHRQCALPAWQNLWYWGQKSSGNQPLEKPHGHGSRWRHHPPATPWAWNLERPCARQSMRWSRLAHGSPCTHRGGLSVFRAPRPCKLRRPPVCM